MAFTQAQLDAMDTAIATMVATGAPQRVKYGEKDITYHALADILAARSIVAGGVAAANRRVPRFQVADFSC